MRFIKEKQTCKNKKDIKKTKTKTKKQLLLIWKGKKLVDPSFQLVQAQLI